MDSHSATTGSDPGATPPNVMTSVSGLPIWRSPSESCSWSSKRAQRETAPEAEEAKNRGKPLVQSRTHMSAVNQVTLRRQCATMHGILPRPPTLAQPVFLRALGKRRGVGYNGTMRALIKTAPQPGLTATTCPDPTPGPHDAVIRVKATSLCGTDAHIYNWDPWAHSRVHPPRIIGHEMCGEVVEVGPSVKLVKTGDYVAAESHLTCGTCFQCRTGQAHVCRNYRILGVDRDGSFAEYVVLRENVLWKTSPAIPPEFASVQEPLGNAVDAALVDDVTGHTVLITGCGPTGLFAAAVARTSGAATIIATDVSDYRLSLAKQVGVDHVLNAKTESPEAIASAIQDITDGEGVDASLEMSGNPS